MKNLFAMLLLVLTLTGCGGDRKENIPLAELLEDYSLEQAKADGVVVHENGDITSGQEAWDAFTEAVSAGEAASVRLGFYYTLDEPSRYDPEYYESVKDEYPVLFVQDLDFDGETYTLSSMEDGEPWTKNYRYLVRYEEDAPAQASYDRITAWMLLNDEAVAQDETMTYCRIFESLASAVAEDHIDFKTVYQDRV